MSVIASLEGGVLAEPEGMQELVDERDRRLIRSAIGDDPHAPRYIRTVRGFGYAFCDGAAAGSAAASLAACDVQCRLIWGDREVALSEGESILGRTPEAAVWVDHGSVSRRHARLTVRDGQVLVEDLGSRHGTRVDGREIKEPTPLGDGARFELGSVAMVFRVFHAADTDSRDA